MDALGLLLPELILTIGALLVFILDVAYDTDRESGASYALISGLILVVAFLAAAFQMNMAPRQALMMDIDAFAAFIKMIIFAGMALVALAGGRYMNRRTYNQGEFWTFFLVVSLAMSILAGANNLVLIYITIELLSITSYMLAAFFRDDLRSAEAGMKYFLYGSVASAVMLYGLSFIYGAVGSLDLREVAAFFVQPELTEELRVAMIPATLLTLAGLAPFYQWAPDTYDGSPTPVATYLSTASKTAAFAVLARFFVVGLSALDVEWVPILAGLSILTMTMGNLAALRQDNVKRLLAYSSVAHAGYILMGLVAVAANAASGMDGLNGVLLYLFAYLFTNVGAFVSVMAVEETVGSVDLKAFQGLIRRSPALTFMFTIFLLSLAGIPATGGFLGKFFVFGAAVQHQYYWLVAIALVNSGIAAFYYLRVVRAMYFTEGDSETSGLEFPLGIQVALLICTLATLWIGLYPPKVLDWVNTASQQILSSLS